MAIESVQIVWYGVGMFSQSPPPLSVATKLPSFVTPMQSFGDPHERLEIPGVSIAVG